MRVNRRQSVAEHSFYVALYAVEIARFIGWEGSYEQLMLHALTHDLDEIVTGDINSPTKRAMSKTAKEDLDHWVSLKMRERSSPNGAWFASYQDEQATAIVKLADHIEGLFYLADEHSMGNRNVQPLIDYVWPRFMKFFGEFLSTLKLNNGKLETGGALMDEISYAFEKAKHGHDKVVSE